MKLRKRQVVNVSEFRVAASISTMRVGKLSQCVSHLLAQ
jgi:hypothetical protein